MSKSDDFDLETWISSARMPERSVTLYARGDLFAEHQAAEQALRDAKNAARGEDRMGSGSDLSRRVREIEAEMKASALTFRVRGLTSAEQDRVRKDASDKDDISPEWLAISTVAPTVTVEQVRKIRDTVGVGQFSDWFSASVAATNEKVTVPFSLAASN